MPKKPKVKKIIIPITVGGEDDFDATLGGVKMIIGFEIKYIKC